MGFIENETAGAINIVPVKYDEHQEFDVPEDRYRTRGQPPHADALRFSCRLTIGTARAPIERSGWFPTWRPSPAY